ncbi:MAG: hypothetical protein ACKVU2_15650 [Saprospiraceae bacterium]
MNEHFLHRLCRQVGKPDLADALSNHLSAPDLSALLLEVYHRRTEKIVPSDVLAAYRQNRFTRPSSVDTIAFRDLELTWLRAGKESGFEPLELSPVAPFGACSALGTVHQNKVMTALRGTEVVADCTNIMALESSARRQRLGFPTASVDLCAAHRLLRTQQVPDVPGFTTHFGLFCLSTAGRDSGNFLFEKTNVARHIGFYLDMLRNIPAGQNLTLVLKALDPETGPNHLFDTVLEYIDKQSLNAKLEIDRVPQARQQYYRALQFGIVLEYGQNRYPIIDGGLTDWTQRLTGNQKERFVASAVGLEFLWKLLTGNL